MSIQQYDFDKTAQTLLTSGCSRAVSFELKKGGTVLVSTFLGFNISAPRVDNRFLKDVVNEHLPEDKIIRFTN